MDNVCREMRYHLTSICPNDFNGCGITAKMVLEHRIIAYMYIGYVAHYYDSQVRRSRIKRPFLTFMSCVFSCFTKIRSTDSHVYLFIFWRKFNIPKISVISLAMTSWKWQGTDCIVNFWWYNISDNMLSWLNCALFCCGRVITSLWRSIIIC